MLRSQLANGIGAPGDILSSDREFAVACGEGAVRLIEVQRAGKTPVQIADFLRGATFKPASRRSEVPRYKLTIEYDGAPFVGWQRQTNGMSVHRRWKKLFCLHRREHCHARRGPDGCRRSCTRTGAHVDLSRNWTPNKIREAMNARIRPHPVSIIEVEEVAGDFEARFSATRRHYLYLIDNRRAPPALDRHHVWHVPRKLDAEAMQAAAQVLVGKHDFTTFRASECQANFAYPHARRFERD